MRPRWGFAFAAVALLAAVLSPVPFSGMEYHDDDDATCKTSLTAKQCAEEHYTRVVKWNSDRLAAWKTLLTNATWKPSTNCQKVKGWALDAIARADGSATEGNRMYIYFGRPKENGNTRGGNYGGGLANGTEDMIVVNDTLDRRPGPWTWKAFLHEAAHAGGLSASHNESFNANDAMDCGEISDDPDPNGGGGGTEEDPEDETCTTSTEWVLVNRDCSYWGGPSGLTLVVCTEEIWIPTEVTVCT